MSDHPLLIKAAQELPDVLSIYWNGNQVLRIESGEVALEKPGQPSSSGLLTFHFDDDPIPVYSLVLVAEDDS